MRKIILSGILILSISSFAIAQNVTGVVKDNNGAPIIGATVAIKSAKLYAATDINGQFSLVAPKAFPFSLRVTATGFKPQDIQVYELTDEPLGIDLTEDGLLSEVTVTARRRSETAQDVPIPISVIGGTAVEDAGAFNVNRVKELVPTVQLYSSNPRNTTLNIRGLGSTFGLTNDGIDPGVGFYVDGVYYARPAATTLDFIDIEQIEVLRGPQGTLFGKNTTAGAFNIKTRAASFTPGASFEVSYGNYGYVQAKASVTGPLGKKLAGRLSFSGTQRDGVIYNVVTQQHINDLNNLGVRGQLLYRPSNKVNITFAGDFNRQRPQGYAQVVAGVVPTLRPAYRQFENIIKDLNYDLPTRNPFERIVDHDTPWRSGNDLGGVSVNIDAKLGGGTLTSTTAWRYWNWDPSNDRDFTGLSVLRYSQAPSVHTAWTQEVRYAGKVGEKVSGVVGIFLIDQDLKSDPFHTEESGDAQWRFSQSSTSPLWATPGLLDGYGIHTTQSLKTFGAAAFGQIDWQITSKLHLLPGIRYNYDTKDVDFDRKTYGGLDTNDPALIAIKRQVYTDQAFKTKASESNVSGQLTLAYNPIKGINSFVTYATSYKPIGVNLGGLPTANGEILLDLATIKPEQVRHLEFGIKTSPSPYTTLNLVAYTTDIHDYQTNVQTAEVGVNRGYLANAEEVRVSGIELEGGAKLGRNLSLYASGAYTDGKYVTFTNAPVPLEETGAPNAFKDISGGALPGISKLSAALGGELTSNSIKILNTESKVFLGVDFFTRSNFSSSPSPSKYLNIGGYALVNARFGFRSSDGLSAFIWGRNIAKRNYFEQLLPAAGNAGHYAAVLGDPQTYGVTLRYSF